MQDLILKIASVVLNFEKLTLYRFYLISRCEGSRLFRNLLQLKVFVNKYTVS